MKTKLFFLLIFILSVGIKTGAQENKTVDSIRFSGIIYDRDSLTVLPYARYTLHNRNYTSNKNGEFYLWAKQGDIIKFSYVGYKDTYIHVHDSLDRENYLIGVFLSKDTVHLSEVIVMPRYQQLLIEAKYMPIIVDPDYILGNQNVKESTYQALTQTPKRMDAEQNQSMVIEQHILHTAYKTQVPPDKMFGPSTEKHTTFTMYISPFKQNKIQKAAENNLLNPNETRFLLNLYREQKNKEVNEDEK